MRRKSFFHWSLWTRGNTHYHHEGGKLNNKLSTKLFFLCLNKVNVLLFLCFFPDTTTHKILFTNIQCNSFDLLFHFFFGRFYFVDSELVTLTASTFHSTARTRHFSVVNKLILLLCAVCARKRQRRKNNFLRKFALIVYVHPFCARNSCRNAMPRHASSARAEETFQRYIGWVTVALTSLAVC